MTKKKKTASQGAEKRIYSSGRFIWLVFGFYLLSFSFRFLPITPGVFGATILLMAFAAGLAIVAITKQCNFWVLFTIGFIQPLVLLIPQALSDPDTLLLIFSPAPPILFGLACATGALIPLLWGIPKARAFSISDWGEWFDVLLKGEKTIKKIESLVKILLFGGTLILELLRFARHT